MAVAALGAGVLTRLTAIISADTSGFELGPVMKGIEGMNKQWEASRKSLQPVTDLFNKIQGTFHKLTGIFKEILAPMAIAGALFLGFLLTGEAGRSVFEAFGSILGAFADVVTGALLPAIQPVLDILVSLLPKWEAIFGTQAWHDTMVALGDALATLVQAGMDVLLQIIETIVQVAPVFLGFFIDLANLAATVLIYLKQHPEFLQAIVIGLTAIVGAIVSLGAAGIVGLFVGVALAVGEIGAGIQFFVDHWPDIQQFFHTFRDALPILSRMVDFGNMLVGIFDSFKGSLATVFDTLKKIGDIVTAPANAGASIGQTLTDFWNSLPHFQMGGPVFETGPAVLHAGEFVVPAGGAGAGGIGATTNIYIFATGGSDDIANEIANRIQAEQYLSLRNTVNTLR